MVNLELYSVRYWIGPVELEKKNVPPYLLFKDILTHYSDLLPMNIIDDDGPDLWLYCAFPISDSMKKCIYNFTNGYFALWLEDDLKDYKQAAEILAARERGSNKSSSFLFSLFYRNTC